MKTIYTHQALEEADFTLNSILDISSEGFWDWNAESGHVERSHGWFRMLGYEIGIFKKDVYTWENVIHSDDFERVMKYFEAYINGEIPEYKIKYRCKKSDGTYLWIEDSAKIVQKTQDGKVVRMIGAHTDIHDTVTLENALIEQNKLLSIDNASLEDLVKERTCELNTINAKLRAKIKEAEHDATHDALTNLFNRRMFTTLFEKEMYRARRYSYPLSIVLLDVDRFKDVNDTYGHKLGDEVLVDLAMFLEQSTRGSDIVARWGGEEFIIVFPQNDIHSAESKANSLRTLIEGMVFPNSLRITCSFGVTQYRQEDTQDSFFIRCDNALYKAKKNSRNNVQVL